MIFVVVTVVASAQMVRMSSQAHGASGGLAILGLSVIVLLSYGAAVFFGTGPYVDFRMCRQGKQIAEEIRAKSRELE